MNKKSITIIIRLLIYVAIGFGVAFFWHKMKSN
jgi:flagellar basal body-associated protein FliL